MEKPIADQLLEKLRPNLNQRIKALKYSLKNSKTLVDLINGRENALNLLKEYPKDSRIKSLVQEFNQKLGGK